MSDDVTSQPLPFIGERSIVRVKALWRSLLWAALPESFANDSGDDALPDSGSASMLGTLRVLHGSSSPAEPKAEQAQRDVLEALKQGRAAVLAERAADAGRIDLASELFELSGREHVALELAVVTIFQPAVAYAARTVAGRLGFESSVQVSLLDEVLGHCQVGAGLMRSLCSQGGALHEAGLLTLQHNRVVATAALHAFIDGGPSPMLPQGRIDGLPPEAMETFKGLRRGWVSTLCGAIGQGRPLLVTAASGGGLATLSDAVAAQLDVPLLLVDCVALWQQDHDAGADSGGAALAALSASAHLWPQLIALQGVEELGAMLREKRRQVLPWLERLSRIERPLLLLHEGPVSPMLASSLALAGGVPQLDLPPAKPSERAKLLSAALAAAKVDESVTENLASEVQHYGFGLGQVGLVVAATLQRTGARLGRLRARGELDDPVQTLVPSLSEMRAGVMAATSTRLSAFGSRVETSATWDDLILPEEIIDQVKTVARFARLRTKLFEEWGFDRKMPYGKALSVMFAGPSGTGKTMVAGLIAKDLGVELYRIDLGRLVSKFVGETEERLGALFDEATQTGAALLFDEADSLFGQRTEIKSANDRYANLEVNYLLQRLEDFDGVVFLTTNFGSSIDEAFLRRIRFRLTFPFPSSEERQKMWEVMLPEELPLDEEGDPADWQWLGESFELSGGHIRNAVLRSAMLAAEADMEVGMRHLYDAAAAEYRELGKLAPPYPFDDDWD
ncbi:MAG TPA: hypothetical protein DCQ06_11825 [Myxococcales bacterium]|nr:hypothetical protein [Myxococcales bacterium]HAN32277.1 hypothetical protein [Myxococcales bacterium]